MIIAKKSFLLFGLSIFNTVSNVYPMENKLVTIGTKSIDRENQKRKVKIASYVGLGLFVLSSAIMMFISRNDKQAPSGESGADYFSRKTDHNDYAKVFSWPPLEKY